MFSETKITEIYCMADDFLYVQLTLEGMVRIFASKKKVERFYFLIQEDTLFGHPLEYCWLYLKIR